MFHKNVHKISNFFKSSEQVPKNSAEKLLFMYFDRLRGIEHELRVFLIDQTRIGKESRVAESLELVVSSLQSIEQNFN